MTQAHIRLPRATRSMRASSRVLFPATVAIAAYGVGTREAKACHPVQMCATWTDVVMEDGPFGDLVTGTDYAARGARVRVIRPYPEPALEMYLDDEGCGSFDSQFTTGHKVLVFTEAVLGAGTNNQIHIKSYESEEAKEANVDSAFPADMPSMPEDWGLAVSGPADPEHRVEHLAIATEVLYRLQGLPETLLTGGHTLKIWVDPMAQNASAPIGEVRVGAAGDEQGLSALGKKLILAHEIGHWIQLELTGEFWSLDYGYGPIEPPPRRDGDRSPSGR